MDIEIGKWPDFVLTRGHEILSYQFQMVIQFPTQKTVARTLTHRSLAMICKEVKSIYQYAAGVKCDRDLEIDFSTLQITIGVKTSTVRAHIDLKGPIEMSPSQSEAIIRDFIGLFNVQQSGGKMNF